MIAMTEKMRVLGLAALLGLGFAALSGCDNDGPLEEAGEEIGDAVEDAGDEIEDALD